MDDDMRLRLQRLEAAVATLEGERSSLAAEAQSLRDQVVLREAECNSLREHVAEIEREHLELAARFEAVERQSTALASLYVASCRLHGSAERRDVVEAIEEIVVNLIGCEEMALFEADPAQKRLVRSSSVGLDAAEYTEVRIGEGTLGRVAAEREAFVADGSRATDDPRLTACVPLLLEDRLVGVLALFRLLSHKPGLIDQDRELLDLLGRHAASALHYSGLAGRTPEGGH